MPTFQIQFALDEIEPLAARFPLSEDEDARHLVIGSAARSRGYYTRREFLVVCRWKTPRSAPRVESNGARRIRRATSRALTETNETVRMEALLELTGVGVPTASTLLYFAFPADYPVLDVRALESLGVKPRSQYPASFWLGYLEACRELAAEGGVSIRTLDKALWQHSKERGPQRPRPA